jgi:hypothetical protein
MPKQYCCFSDSDHPANQNIISAPFHLILDKSNQQLLIEFDNETNGGY